MFSWGIFVEQNWQVLDRLLFLVHHMLEDFLEKNDWPTEIYPIIDYSIYVLFIIKQVFEGNILFKYLVFSSNSSTSFSFS